MLKQLRLTHIILVEKEVINFSSGFNVLSGESGSGKSAILNALNLIAGDKSDASVVRRGEEKGIVEAIFDIETLPLVAQFLADAGIDHEAGSELIIRREIFATGKSRAFINHQPSQIALLKKLTPFLCEIVGQHANQKLLSLEYHLHTLDLFGELEQDTTTFFKCWEEETATRKKLNQLISSEAERLRESEVCEREIAELEDAQLKEGEEEVLFAEYTLLSHADALTQKTGELNRALSSDKMNLMAQLFRQKLVLDELASLDPSLQETAASYNSTLLELQEIVHTLKSYHHRIENNPARMQFLDDRIKTLNLLKRKYGSSVAEMQAYLEKAKIRLHVLENANNSIEALQSQLATLEETSNSLSRTLTQKRKAAALELEKALVHHLRALNMPKVEIFIDISSQKRGRLGDDRVEFFLSPNVGEHRVSLRECASGGELSRMMLALQALLAGKEQIPTLIFDEIDANIGGETAAVVGEKLLEIGEKHQVLCITHFPQVAKLSKHHLQIFKQEIEGRTVTQVRTLTKTTQKQELSRMLGGVS